MGWKENLIERMKCRPLGCTGKNLPPGTECAFRAFTNGEITAHKSKHETSINSGKRTKAKYFEIDTSSGNANKEDGHTNEGNVVVEFKQTRIQEELTSKYSAVCGRNGQVVLVEQESLLNLVDKRLKQINSERNVVLIDEASPSLDNQSEDIYNRTHTVEKSRTKCTQTVGKENASEIEVKSINHVTNNTPESEYFDPDFTTEEVVVENSNSSKSGDSGPDSDNDSLLDLEKVSQPRESGQLAKPSEAVLDEDSESQAGISEMVTNTSMYELPDDHDCCIIKFQQAAASIISEEQVMLETMNEMITDDLPSLNAIFPNSSPP